MYLRDKAKAFDKGSVGRLIKKAIKITAFLLITLVLFLVVQEIMVPDWNETGGVEKTISGFLMLEENTVDVVFIGASHIGRGVSPMELYEDAGILSYNLGTSGQPIEGSYVLLQEAFRTQDPGLVVLDCSMMFEKDVTKKNNYYRYIMDNLYLTPGFEAAVEEYENIPENDGVLSAYLPITKFHSRWNQMEEVDFDLKLPQEYYTMGYYVTSGIVAGPSIEETEKNTADAEVQITKAFIDYFEKIRQLCEENDAQLLLVKVPCYYKGAVYAWYKAKSEAAAAFAQEQGVTMLDMHYMDLVDPALHSYDGGDHLNIVGAQKVTAYLCSYIKEHYPQYCGKSAEQFEQYLPEYRKVRSAALLQTTSDFSEFVQILADNQENWTIYVTSYKNHTAGMTEADYELLGQLGLTEIAQAQNRTPYMAVVSGGEVLYEKLSDEAFEHTMTVGENIVELGAAAYAADDISTKILINGVEYGSNKRGLNFVVWDNETDLPLCITWFDTHTEEKTYGYKASTPNMYLRAFEEAVWFED